MITRYYICDACNYSFCIQQELHDDKRLKKCPSCKKHKLYQDLTGQHTYVYGEPQTLQLQADRNRNKFGKYELESKLKEQKDSKKRIKLESAKNMGLVSPEATELPSSKTVFNPEGLDLKTELKDVIKSPESVQKYIIEGKK